MSYDIPFSLRQNTNFFYYTGFNDPEGILVMEKISDNLHTETMFVREKIPEKELWEGPRCGPSNAVSKFGVNNAYTLDQLHILNDIIRKSSSRGIFINSVRWDSLKIDYNNKTLYDVEPYLQMSRLVKSQSEIKMMMESGSIAGQSFQDMMKFVKPGMNDYQASAFFEFSVKNRGAQHAQKQLYEAVLDVNKKCIEMCRAGETINTIHRYSVELIIGHLLRLGILDRQPGTLSSTPVSKQEIEDNVRSGKYHKYYPHSIGHYLGMDTHDTMSIPYGEILKPGMIITIEPGIYINEYDHEVSEQWRGINIRVEDDVVITDTDPINLTIDAPKEVDHIESIMNTSNICHVHVSDSQRFKLYFVEEEIVLDEDDDMDEDEDDEDEYFDEDEDQDKDEEDQDEDEDHEDDEDHEEHRDQDFEEDDELLDQYFEKKTDKAQYLEQLEYNNIIRGELETRESFTDLGDDYSPQEVAQFEKLQDEILPATYCYDKDYQNYRVANDLVISPLLEEMSQRLQNNNTLTSLTIRDGYQENQIYEQNQLIKDCFANLLLNNQTSLKHLEFERGEEYLDQRFYQSIANNTCLESLKIEFYYDYQEYQKQSVISICKSLSINRSLKQLDIGLVSDIDQDLIDQFKQIPNRNCLIVVYKDKEALEAGRWPLDHSYSFI
ncbi:hypothetical protein DFA_11110 [Cavenderia fasciculata]|uniref:Aminopeptidase P N-terminal domain-containing protein n=1 Tax=Cavenderia fasciculata TaxID=261658 RepID=F4QEZ0_CACFS|nr:uncharacterized protein DFA_11110 [Cavenderia fasciculata]EGG13349.1 hypothetical protein DFA_11110 [Cavenderia fasciculata]|eukprot:XP_004350053.1 hypothetical protein DFA_11110 [Cavenderia fasciculata]